MGTRMHDAPRQDTLACMHPATPPMNTYSTDLGRGTNHRCLSPEGHGMACRSQTIEPYYFIGYGSPGSTMVAPAEPRTLLLYLSAPGRRHSLGMHGSQCADGPVTWCHIVDSLWARHSHVPQCHCHMRATKCHMTAFEGYNRCTLAPTSFWALPCQCRPHRYPARRSH